MADNRTMAQMLQAPIEGYEDAIVVPPINANNFELKQTLINLVQSNQFTGKQDPHNHLRFFNKVTSTFRHPEVPNTSIKLLLFPFSLEGEARIWLDKEPPRSILTWDDLVSKFINQFFPPSKTTYLRNKITTVKAVEEVCVTCGSNHNFNNYQNKDKEPIKEPSLFKDQELFAYPSRLCKEKIREKDDTQASEFMEIFRNLHFEQVFAMLSCKMPKFALMFKKMLNTKRQVISQINLKPLKKIDCLLSSKSFPKSLVTRRFLIPCDFRSMIIALP
ncbi:reverse transcriptase domain-containing protein [Tanacetum coccineum]